jgi:hypothetical protein
VASEPKLGGISEENGRGGGYADDRSRSRSAFEFETVPKSGSLGLHHNHPSVIGPGRSATLGGPGGPGVQRWPEPAGVSEVTA